MFSLQSGLFSLSFGLFRVQLFLDLTLSDRFLESFHFLLVGVINNFGHSFALSNVVVLVLVGIFYQVMLLILYSTVRSQFGHFSELTGNTYFVV